MSRGTRHVLLIFQMFMSYMCGLVYSEVLVLCPEKIHWKTVGQVYCPDNPEYFHCLQRKNTYEFKPECIMPVMIPEGYYPVLDDFHQNIDIENCPVEQYQPRPMSTNEDYQCVYPKSKCSDEGQLVYSNGSTTEDTACRCDYRKGYTFVNMPARQCDCVPSVEDCSCYRNTCASHSDLTKDYECLSNGEKVQNKTSTGRNCSLIPHSSYLDGQSSDKNDFNPNEERYSNIQRQDTMNRKHPAIVIVTVLCIYALITVILYLWKKHHNKHDHTFLANVPTEIQQLGKPGYEKFKGILKATVCKHRTIQLIFVGPKCSGKTSLLHNILGGINMVDQTRLLNKFCLRLESEKWTITDYIKDKSGNILNIIKTLEDKDHVKELQNNYIDLIITDIPGGREYLSVFEPFLSRKALYVLTVDVSKELTVVKKHTLSNPKIKGEPLFILHKSGEEIQYWLYSIHSLKPADQDLAKHLVLQPPLILVGTHEDKVLSHGRDLVQKLERDSISCVYQKKSIISKHIVHSCVLSNEQFSAEKKKDLQDIIIKVSQSQDNWDNDIPVRYLWFEDILLEKRSKMATMSFDDILELGNASGYPVTDKQEFQQFLSYEHEVRNVIFYPDIPDFVIINPEWLLGIFKALITLFHSETESKSDYQLRGLISENSLNTILQDLGSDWLKSRKLLQTFDVVVGARNAGKIESEHESSYSYEYYVPFVIPGNCKADVVSLFSRSRRTKTSFLCFSFDYLPAALVNHVMIRLLERYEVSVTPETGESAVYHRTLVLEYNSRNNLKLYFYSQKNELLIQVWFYGVQEILVCFEIVRKFLEQIINSYKIRHGINMKYIYKLKCPDSIHADTDVWDILSINADRTYYCHHHQAIHHEIYTTWFSGDKENKVKESTGAKKNLEVMMGKTIQERASGYMQCFY